MRTDSRCTLEKLKSMVALLACFALLAAACGDDEVDEPATTAGTVAPTTTAAPPETTAAPEPEPDLGLHLSRDVAASFAASMQVDGALTSSLRSLGDPLGGLQVGTVEGPSDIEKPDLAGCVSMLDAGADSDGDGYPAEETTLDLDCELLVLHLGGTLVLEDKDDMDRDSGFRSEVDFRISLVVENQKVEFVVGKQAMDVDAIDGGAGYVVSQSGEIKVPIEEPFLEGEVRLTYAGTLEGSFRSGTLTIDAGDGTFTFATIPIDCSKLAGDEGEACRAQAPENPGPSLRLAVNSTGLAFDKESCATAITEGYFDVQDGSGNVLRISYDGCGERSATYNGEIIPIPPPEE